VGGKRLASRRAWRQEAGMTQPPKIFAPQRRLHARRRMIALQQRADAPRYVIEDMVEDVIERLGFLRVVPGRALVIGDYSGALAGYLRSEGAEVVEAEPAAGWDEEAPFAQGGFDFIASLGALDTVNDLPGALIHMRHALAPGGLMMASFMASGSLPALRGIMLAADGDRPEGRLHPMVDVRAGAELLQRAGFADPVADGRGLDVRFRSARGLVGDLRAMGMSAVLAMGGRPLGKAAYARFLAAFDAAAVEGRVTERFEMVTLSGWRR